MSGKMIGVVPQEKVWRDWHGSLGLREALEDSKWIEGEIATGRVDSLIFEDLLIPHKRRITHTDKKLGFRDADRERDVK